MVRLVYKYKNEDIRELTFEDWILYIIKENKDKLPWNKINEVDDIPF